MKDKLEYKRNNVVGALMNIQIFVGTFSILTDFAVLKDMDAYRDEGMGDVIFGELFLREVGINAKRFKGIITIHNALVTEVPLASALQVLRRLGSIFISVYVVLQKLKKDSWLELQFSLADNSKLNITLEYRGGQLNAAPVLEVENFTNWKKIFMCHIIGIEPQFENIISNGRYIPMDDLILYHEGPFDVKESKVMDLKLCYNTFKFKEGESLTQIFIRYKALMNELVNYGIKLLKLEINTGFINRLPKKWLSLCQSLRNTNHVKDSEIASLFGKLKYEENLIDGIYETEKSKYLVSATPLSTAFFSSSIVQDFQDSPDDEEDTRSSYEYLNDLEEEYQARDFLAKSERFFKKGTQKLSNAKATDQTKCHKCGKKGHFARGCWSKTSVPSYQSPFQSKLLFSSENKPEPSQIKDFEAKYHKVKAKLALLYSSASALSSSPGKNKGLITEMYDWDDEEVSSDENEVTEVKALMALTNEEKVSVGKESDRNGDWTKISMKKHVNTEILKENQNLNFELKELKSITETWLNSSNIVNQCINEQIPTQKKKILGIDQLTKDTSSSGFKDPVFIKSSANNSDMSITSSNIPKSSITEDFTLPNQDTDEVPSNESQRNTTNPSAVFFVSPATDYDSADESSVYSTSLPPLKKLDGAELISGPKTFKSILKSKSTFKAETLKGITINKPSSAPAGGKSSSASKTYFALAGKLKIVKMEDDPPLAIVMKELNELKLQISKKKSSYSRNKNAQQVPPNALQNRYKTQFKMNCELCGQNSHLSENCYEVLFCKKCKRTNHSTCDHADFMFSMNANQHHNGQGESSSSSRPSRPSVSFPSCIHCGYKYHHSNDCLYFPTCEICGSYDHDTHDHNRIISLRRGINHRNPQHVTKNYETLLCLILLILIKVYKVIKLLYGLHQAPRAWYETLSSFLMENGFRRETATTILSLKTTDVKDEDGIDVDISSHSKSFTLKCSKKDFRYLKHQPKLGLWYPRDSPFELEAYSDSDYGGASLDRKSTTGGCQFLGRRLISWQCKKQTIVANSTTEAEYVAAANCCGQVLWIQNQMMDYGFNFMNTKIHIDNESTISVIKNPVAHSRTKHIEIRFHFIRDCYEKRLIEVIKIHTDHNVADLLTKGFDVTRISMDLRMDRSWAANSSYSWSIFLKGTSLRTQQLVASIDSKEYTITEASVRSKLQLADATRIHNLSDAEIYPGLATLGYVTEGDFVPLLPTMLAGAAVDPSEGSAQPAEPHHTPVDPLPSTSLPPIPSPPQLL
ncbi:retrovirus-related pol polyprotein from transposon TNT 1-94 [Tanacetum coccineum]|uniref:Retrovirus-related pol polyprotein from transposon TNT 1-94 n=1 Tax=Tanacetum coccineum TaxID=301880 RepID=A0ABQ5HNK3_9ASTR